LGFLPFSLVFSLFASFSSSHASLSSKNRRNDRRKNRMRFGSVRQVRNGRHTLHISVCSFALLLFCSPCRLLFLCPLCYYFLSSCLIFFEKLPKNCRHRRSRRGSNRGFDRRSTISDSRNQDGREKREREMSSDRGCICKHPAMWGAARGGRYGVGG
jgi:hypothetical protein